MNVYKNPETDFIQNNQLQPLDLPIFGEEVIKDVCFFITPALQKILADPNSEKMRVEDPL